MSAERTLVLGGARSGKSALAERLAAESGLEVVYVATAQAFDAEMAERIARHQTERPTHWRTVEAPLALPEAIGANSAAHRLVLIDCLTLWLSNLMLAEEDAEEDPDAAGATLIEALTAAEGPVICVSNEVGLGIVPENALARRFRDAQGRLNRQVAEIADRVLFIAAGLPLELKPGRTL